jgi:penicillin-binding protein 2
VVIHPETFEILAIASYPSYTMEQYENDYATLVKDETAPMFFRAVNGTYAPGSTFKVGMSVAALESGIITPYTTINTTNGPHMKYGKYTYYSDYQPTCWIRNMYGGSHGTQNVQAAIKNSCNLFFFEMGRLMGIDAMNSYCKNFGLGEQTGIEISESTGVLAGPDYREKYNLRPWTGGDTIAAAIGQSDNLFTPLQLCSYLSMMMNGGNRYNAHLLYQVKNYGSNDVVDTAKKELLSSVSISESTLATIKRGMREVLTSSASTKKFFTDCPVAAILKTGTAEVGGTRSDNATMIGYGENEEKGGIAISVVIEQGMSGSNCGIVVNAIMKQYFGSK